MEPKYSLIIEALRLMFKNKTTSISKIKKLYNDHAISLEEYQYIIGKEDE